MLMDEDILEEIYKSNILILYKELSDNIWDYRSEHKEATVKIRAYLPALLNAIASYQDSCLKSIDCNETTEILACKYANNALKHNPRFAVFTHEDEGGIAFPFHFPMTIPAPDVFWRKTREDEVFNEGTVKYKQSTSYRSLFESKSVLLTLEQVLNSLNIKP